MVMLKSYRSLQQRKKICKLIKNWQSYSYGYGDTVFLLTLYYT